MKRGQQRDTLRTICWGSNWEVISDTGECSFQMPGSVFGILYTKIQACAYQ
jgi:hypothetical protein